MCLLDWDNFIELAAIFDFVAVLKSASGETRSAGSSPAAQFTVSMMPSHQPRAKCR